MSKFSSKVQRPVDREPDILNEEQAPAFSLSAELKLVQMMLTSFLEAQFYRSADKQEGDLRDWVKAVDPKFAAKAALYARYKGNMRSTSHVAAVEVARAASGQKWVKYFIRDVIRRPDDAIEMVAYYMANYATKNKNGKYRPLPAALKKGVALALSYASTPWRRPFDEYQIAKYARSNSALSLVDVVRLCHVPVKEGDPVDKLVKGTLPLPDTWEVKSSKLGQENLAIDELADAKAEMWAELASGRMGYLALLRNLRNIYTHSIDSVATVIPQLRDPDRVSGSGVFPFQIYVAYSVISSMPMYGSQGAALLDALNEAMTLSLKNVPKFSGLVVALDASSSMNSKLSYSHEQLNAWKGKTLCEVASLFAAALMRGNSGSDLVFYNTEAYTVPRKPASSLLVDLAEYYMANLRGGGTTASAVLRHLEVYRKEPIELLVFFTDEQTWGERSLFESTIFEKEWRSFCRSHQTKFGSVPTLVIWNLAGYGSSMMPEEHVITLAGFTDNMFQILEKAISDPRAMVREIEAMPLSA